MSVNRFIPYLFLLIAVLGVTVPEAFASGAENGGHVRVANVLFSLVLLLLAAKLGGELFERWNQPAVLGELVFGVILGNVALIGYHGLDAIKTHPGIAFAAEVGVILLLFEVGLESNLDELLAVGSSAALVAVLGIVAPVILVRISLVPHSLQGEASRTLPQRLRLEPLLENDVHGNARGFEAIEIGLEGRADSAHFVDERLCPVVVAGTLQHEDFA